MPVQNRTLGFLACGVAAALWGTGFFFGKIALREMSVGHMVFYRFLFAALPMLFLLPRRKPGFSRHDWSLLLLGAFFGIPLQFLIEFYGLSLTTLAHAALMVGTMPVIVATGAALLLGERMDRVGWLALAGSTAGAALIALSHSRSTAGTASLFGDLLVIVAMLLALVWVITSKRLLDRHGTTIVSSYGLLVGTAMLAVWVFAVDGLPPVHGISWQAWSSLAASGLLCTASTTLLWNWSMTQVPASEAGVFLNIEPIMGSVLSICLFHERLGWTAWIGGAMIVGSALVLTTQSSTAVREPEVPLAPE